MEAVGLEKGGGDAAARTVLGAKVGGQATGADKRGAASVDVAEEWEAVGRGGARGGMGSLIHFLM